LKYLEWLAIAMNLYIANEKFAFMDFPMLSSVIFILLVIIHESMLFNNDLLLAPSITF
jgi:hypothetical protein